MRRRHLRYARREIAKHGVAIVEADITLGWRTVTVHYTAGLTRHEGHPELIVVDECCDCARRIADGAAQLVRAGTRLDAGWGLTVDGWLHVLVEVEQPDILEVAQRLYRLPGGPPVPALQAIGTNEFGALPWESGIGSELMLGPAPR